MNLADQYFSPKTVAQAIGVSESSLKRWCDKGKILATKTAGGHRRLASADIVAFLRKQKIPLQHPEVIGLPSRDAYTIHSISDVQKQFSDCLVSGDEKGCRGMMVFLFTHLWPLEKLVDDVIAPVFREIGRAWREGKLDVYQERRACEVCLAALRELKLLLPPVADNASKRSAAALSMITTVCQPMLFS